MTIHTDPNRAHAIYPWSGAFRWVHCTASAEAIATLPEQESNEAAEEGTAAHDELERRIGSLNGDFVDPATMPILPADPDHPGAYAVAMMIAFVRQLPHGRMWVEQRVALTEKIWGRCDIAHWHEESGVLTIPDLKNGMRAVDPDKEQLRGYGASAITTFGIQPKWLRYVVVQPNDWRPFVPRVKQHIESADSLMEWAGKVAAIPRGPLKFTAGDHCRDCPLFGKCDASLDMLANIGAVISGLVQAETLPADQRALFLACRKPVEDAFKNAEKAWTKQALSTMTAPPGMKIVTGTTKRAWNDEAAARAAVIAKCGVDALDPPTPAQAEKLGLDVSTLASKPEGVPVLAFANDKRPVFERKSVSEMFPGAVK